MNPKRNPDSDSEDEINDSERVSKGNDDAIINEDIQDIVLPAQEAPTGYFISRRMSGMLMITPKHKANFVTDEAVLRDLNTLIAKFPDPPEDSDIVPVTNASTKSNSGGWGLKGLLSAFGGKS